MPSHRRAVESLKEQLLAELKDQIHSMVLFGSVARGEAKPDSDIDFLLITEAPFDTRQRIDEITYDVDLENEVFTQLVFFTTQRFEEEVRIRSYLAADVLTEGVELYDDGTFERIRQQASPAISGIPTR